MENNKINSNESLIKKLETLTERVEKIEKAIDKVLGSNDEFYTLEEKVSRLLKLHHLETLDGNKNLVDGVTVTRG